MARYHDISYYRVALLCTILKDLIALWLAENCLVIYLSEIMKRRKKNLHAEAKC